MAIINQCPPQLNVAIPRIMYDQMNPGLAHDLRNLGLFLNESLHLNLHPPKLESMVTVGRVWHAKVKHLATEIGKIQIPQNVRRQNLLEVRCEVVQTQSFRMDALAAEMVVTRMISRGLWNWEQALERQCIL